MQLDPSGFVIFILLTIGVLYALVVWDPWKGSARTGVERSIAGGTGLGLVGAGQEMMVYLAGNDPAATGFRHGLIHSSFTLLACILLGAVIGGGLELWMCVLRKIGKSSASPLDPQALSSLQDEAAPGKWCGGTVNRLIMFLLIVALAYSVLYCAMVWIMIALIQTQGRRPETEYLSCGLAIGISVLIILLKIRYSQLNSK